MKARVLLAVTAGLLTLAGVAATSYGHESGHAGLSTLQKTAVGNNPDTRFSLLRGGPGEPHIIRRDINRPQSGRERRRLSFAYFGQLTDFQLADEESPARVEFLDADPSGFASSAWRPQEALVPHMTEMSIRQMNHFLSSPITQSDGRRARLMNAVLTGDLADNMQRNETQWVVRLLEGGTVNPSSGTQQLAGTACPTGAGIADFNAPQRYTGVQDYDDYFNHPHFYDPEKPIGTYGSRGWPTYRALMDRAQQPFQAEGLKVPSYSVFGNHDGLVQGNEDAIAAYEEVATGCIKPLSSPGPGLLDALNPDFLLSVISDPTQAFLVPPDQRRQFVDKLQFKDLHRTGAQRDAHGFAYVDAAELRASNGSASYYSFSPREQLRFIVLDTLSEGGVVAESSSGNIDDPQWRWLQRELQRATARDEMVVVWGHHSTGSLTTTVTDEQASRCTTNDEHGHDRNPGCDRDPRSSSPVHLGDELTSLFNRFPHVVAYAAGHSHENRIAPKPDGRGGGWWEIKSPAIVDWPPQNRLIEVMDNADGTISIFGTLLDLDAPLTAPFGGNTSGFGATTLASIGQTLSYNDPQVGPEGTRTDPAGPEGSLSDRNVELLLREPRRNPIDLRSGRRRCANVRARYRGRRFHRASLGARRGSLRRRYPSRRRYRNFDYFCLSDRKRIRVGYPTRRLRRAIGRRRFRRVRNRAVLILTNSRRLRKNRIRVGNRTRTARRRLRREYRVKLGRRTYWIGRGRGARPIVRVSRGRVREVGIVSPRFARKRKTGRRFLRSFRR